MPSTILSQAGPALVGGGGSMVHSLTWSRHRPPQEAEAARATVEHTSAESQCSQTLHGPGFKLTPQHLTDMIPRMKRTGARHEQPAQPVSGDIHHDSGESKREYSNACPDRAATVGVSMSGVEHRCCSKKIHANKLEKACQTSASTAQVCHKLHKFAGGLILPWPAPKLA